MSRLRTWLVTVLGAALFSLQGCGGGGGDGMSTPVPTATPSTNAIVAASVNAEPISVDSGVTNSRSVNLAFTSVMLCVPGEFIDCQTIDHVLIDTGSVGLRILSSALASSLALPQQVDVKGSPVVECAHFTDGYTWGPVKLADMLIAGEKASLLPIQVIGDPKFSAVPSGCSNTGPAKNVAQTMHANGILGLGVFRQDCGNACALSSAPGIYFTCPAAGCRPAVTPVDLQLQNPVSMFAVNNNGVIIELPSVPADGTASLSGSLVFGIGTQTNNAIGSASVIGVDTGTAHFTTLYNGTSYNASTIDSGSNAFFFADAGTPVCASPPAAGFYCPPATQNLSALIQGRNSRSVPVIFSVANADALVTTNPGLSAYSNLGAPQFVANGFTWGLPFFYGRNVYLAIEGANTPAGRGPYVAF